MEKGETKRYELKAKEPGNPYWLKQIIDGWPDKKLVILYDGVSAVFVKRDGKETTGELPAETEGGFIRVRLSDSGEKLLIEYGGGWKATALELLKEAAGIDLKLPQLTGLLGGLPEGVHIGIAAVIDRKDNMLYGRYCFEYEADLKLIPGILELRKAGFVLLAAEAAFGACIYGNFSVAQCPMRIEAEIGFGDVLTFRLRPEEGAFPSLLTMVSWFTGGKDTAGITELGKDNAVQNGSIDMRFLDFAVSGAAVQLSLADGRLEEVLLNTELTLLNIVFTVEFSYKNRMIYGRLKEGQSISFSHILNSAGSGQGGTPEGLAVTAAGVRWNMKSKEYTLDCALTGEWLIGPVCLESVTAYLDYHKESGTLVRVTGDLWIEKKTAVHLLAQYGQQPSGWSFEGSLKDRDGITMASLCAFLTKAFPAFELPAMFSQIKLTGLTIRYETATAAFKFLLSGSICLEKKDLLLKVEISLQKENGSYEGKFSGTLYAGSYEFDIRFIYLNGAEELFTASFTAGEKEVPLGGLLESLTGMRCLPDSLSVKLKQAGLLLAVEQNRKNLFIGTELGIDFSFSGIPVLSDFLPAKAEISIKELKAGYSKEDISSAQAVNWKKQLSGTLSGILPDKEQQAGGFLSGTLRCPPDYQEVFRIGMGAGETVPDTEEVKKEGGSKPQGKTESGNVKWMEINKKIGPVSLQRAGLSFEDGRLFIMADTSILIGPVTVTVDGLGLGSALDHFSPAIRITGLGISYRSPMLEIEGGLFYTASAPSVKWQFDGFLTVKAAKWQLSAIGSYAQMERGLPSMFLLVNVNAALGGVPAFMIEGLMGGFGINRKLRIPEIREVKEFPLLASGASKSQKDILDALNGKGGRKAWLSVCENQYWLAAGIHFSSFGLLYGKLLLVAEFGEELSFSLLGLAEITLPKNAPKENAYVYLELGLRAALKPKSGSFLVELALTDNSFLISRQCHVTGGFAFALWFGSNPHAGQFVLTVGGYHPAFPVPDYYPKVDRVGFNWKAGSQVSIGGEAYLAVTPSCVMAGGSLSVLYASGELKAWFNAYAHLLLAWKPFYFQAEMGVEIGASYRLNLLFCHVTIKVSVGASLKLWGPPTGGTVRIHLSILSFSVSFGSSGSKGNGEPLDWQRFKELLPEKESMLKLSVSDGLYQSMEKEKLWIVRAECFRFLAELSVPEHEALNIRPMDLTGIQSFSEIKITHNGEDVTGHFRKEQARGSVPASLWGKPVYESGHFVQNSSNPSAEVVEHMVTGYVFTAPAPHRKAAAVIENYEETLRKCYDYGNPWELAQAGQRITVAEGKTIKDMESMGDYGLRRKRAAIYRLVAASPSLAGRGREPDDFIRMAGQREEIFADQPMEVSG